MGGNVPMPAETLDALKALVTSTGGDEPDPIELIVHDRIPFDPDLAAQVEVAREALREETELAALAVGLWT